MPWPIVADVASAWRALSMSAQTYYRWRNRYGGLKANDAKRLLAKAELNKVVLKELEERAFHA